MLKRILLSAFPENTWHSFFAVLSSFIDCSSWITASLVSCRLSGRDKMLDNSRVINSYSKCMTDSEHNSRNQLCLVYHSLNHTRWNFFPCFHCKDLLQVSCYNFAVLDVHFSIPSYLLSTICILNSNENPVECSHETLPHTAAHPLPSPSPALPPPPPPPTPTPHHTPLT